MDDRISNLEALKTKLAELLDRSGLRFSDQGHHATACWVEGPPHAVFALLKRKTAPELWSQSVNVLWTYKNPVENILITLQSGSIHDSTLMMASVISLHVECMARRQQAPAEEALQETIA